LGTRPNGEQTRFLRRGVLNGPAILFNNDSCDIEDAFRIIPIHPSDYYLLGFTWNNYFYFDRCLPMGASSSCQIFEKFSCAIQWIMQTKYHADYMFY
jgi:hypothetical protein